MGERGRCLKCGRSTAPVCREFTGQVDRPGCMDCHHDQECHAVKASSSFASIAAEIAALVEAKNAAYGNSFDKCGDFLRLLWPNGVRPEQYTDLLQLVRMFDKFKRIASGAPGEDPHADLVGYALLGLRRKRSC